MWFNGAPSGHVEDESFDKVKTFWSLTGEIHTSQQYKGGEKVI